MNRLFGASKKEEPKPAPPKKEETPPPEEPKPQQPKPSLSDQQAKVKKWIYRCKTK
jgi:hypothetical protein